LETTDAASSAIVRIQASHLRLCGLFRGMILIILRGLSDLFPRRVPRSADYDGGQSRLCQRSALVDVLQ
jgi:hypothetical protein